MHARFVIVASLAVLALPAQAAAHGRSPTVALDFRLQLDAASESIPGVHVHVLDGDRSLELSVTGDHQVVVRGLLREPVLRIGPNGVWVNAASPTAAADRLVSKRGAGWVRLSGVDGRPATIGGTFWRVRSPAAWPWLSGALAFAAAVAAAAAFRRGWRAYLTVGLGTAAGLGALVAVTTFAAKDAPNGRIAWLQIAAGVLVGLVLAAVLVVLHGGRRVHAAGVVGAIAAAASIGSLPVFWHGVVISALPATPARFVCGLALVGGAAAAALSFLPDFDEVRHVRR